jgi:hypothetical protein
MPGQELAKISKMGLWNSRSGIPFRRPASVKRTDLHSIHNPLTGSHVGDDDYGIASSEQSVVHELGDRGVDGSIGILSIEGHYPGYDSAE